MSRVLWIEQVYDPAVVRPYPITSVERALAALRGSQPPEVVVIGPSLVDPVRLAQRLRALDEELVVLIASRHGQVANLRGAIAFNPLVGSHTHLVIDDAGIEEAVEDALQNAVKRRQHRATLDAAQAALQGAVRVERLPSAATFAATMWEASPIGVLALGPGSSRVLNANAVAARLLGMDDELDLIGARLEEVIPPLEDEVWAKMTSGEAGALVDHRIEWVDGEGSERCLEMRAAQADPGRGPLVERAGGPDTGAMLVFLRDVTDQARGEALQRELVEAERAARQHAERAGRAREEIVAMVSHDLRSPLQTVTTALCLLGEEIGESEDGVVVDALQAASNATRHMRRLIDDLLDVTRIETGRLELEYAPLEMSDVVEEAMELVEGAAMAGQVELRSDLPAERPEIRGDHTRIVQVLQNLLGNAIKFSEPGDEVVVSAVTTPDGVRLSVQDQGPGIPEEEQQHLFARFWQAGRRKESGVGLGLAIVRGIVDAHGGCVWVDSAPGRGAAFHVDLPRKPAPH